MRFAWTLAVWAFVLLTIARAGEANDDFSPPNPVLQHGVETRELFAAPRSPGESAEWLAGMRSWREKQWKRLKAKHIDLAAAYDRPELEWTQRDFVQPQVMAHDLFLYDPVSSKYTVEKYLNDVESRYGGVDSILFWPTYPNIGVDERNQYDMTRDLPGGLDALRAMIDEFHHHGAGVKVLLPLNPWDNGTRDEGIPNAQAIAAILNEVGGDGFNGDTMTAPDEEYFEAGLAQGHPLAIEPEQGVGKELKALAWNVLNWGYWYDKKGNYTVAPGVDRYKWLETRHLTHVCQRWAKDRNNELQYAWLNGDGYESWENVWGVWNGITPRDAEVIRRMAIIARALPELLHSPDWEPHTPTLVADLYASRFPLGSRTLWTLVNRVNEHVASRPVLRVPYHGETFYDLWNGTRIDPLIKDGQATLISTVDPIGFGAILMIGDAPDTRLLALFERLHELAQRGDVDSFPNTWQALPQQLVTIAPTQERPDQTPPGMALISGTDHFRFKVSGVEIENKTVDNKLIDGIDVQYPWENKAQFNHDHDLPIHAFYLDKEPVTNAEFARFVIDRDYMPADPHRFLDDWIPAGPGETIGRTGRKIAKGDESRPVTWVSLEDARAYAAWAGKRLPHEWEWQYAAQGTDSRPYPWGKKENASLVPEPYTGRDRPIPEVVGNHPGAATPAGIQDLVGNVWQWTDEFADAHTRAAVVRGGSLYRPQGSSWYFPQALRLGQHGKYLLMAPGLDRSGMIGFRCAADAP